MIKIKFTGLIHLLIMYIISMLIIIDISYSQEIQNPQVQQNISKFGAGLEYANNSEIGFLVQYNLKNIAIIGQVRRCTHDKKIYFSPGIKYYFGRIVYDIAPFINIRYGKLHYDRKWLALGYDYDIVYVWDPSMGQMMPEVRPSYYAYSGSSLINTPAISVAGGGEYIINNFGFNTTLGMSHYTKIEGEFKEKNKFFFTIGAVYYFNK